MWCARLPGYIEDGHVGLRLLGLSDIADVKEALGTPEISAASRLNKTASPSWLSVWWWIRTTFPLIYSIEYNSRRIGFIGIYNLKPGRSSEISLVIYKDRDRKRGYGSRACAIFTKYLKEHHLLKQLIVKIKKDNEISISFWQKLGFRELQINDTVVTLHMDIDDYM
jgi:RimJ/RimL family protein N-acetyltransferase